MTNKPTTTPPSLVAPPQAHSLPRGDSPSPGVTPVLPDHVRRNWQRLVDYSGLSLKIRAIQSSSRSTAISGYPVRIASGWSLSIRDTREYQVTRSAGVSIELPNAPVWEGNDLLHVTGPVTAMVIEACGLFPLHAAGFHFPNGVVAVYASSGGGKSTLAAIAAAQGVTISGDDLLPISRTGDLIGLDGSLRIESEWAPPGWTSRMRLPDGRDWYPLEAKQGSGRLAALLVLSRGASTQLTPIRGHQRLAAVLAASFLNRFEDDADEVAISVAFDLASRLPVWSLQVPEGVELMRQSWPEIGALMRQTCDA